MSSLAKHEFLIDKPFQEILQQSQQRFQEFVGKLKLFAREEEEFGKNFFKANRLSADGVMQLAFQVSVVFDSIYYELKTHSSLRILRSLRIQN